MPGIAAPGSEVQKANGITDSGDFSSSETFEDVVKGEFMVTSMMVNDGLMDFYSDLIGY